MKNICGPLFNVHLPITEIITDFIVVFGTSSDRRHGMMNYISCGTPSYIEFINYNNAVMFRGGIPSFSRNPSNCSYYRATWNLYHSSPYHTTILFENANIFPISSLKDVRLVLTGYCIAQNFYASVMTVFDKQGLDVGWYLGRKGWGSNNFDFKFDPVTDPKSRLIINTKSTLVNDLDLHLKRNYLRGSVLYRLYYNLYNPIPINNPLFKPSIKEVI